MTENITFPQLHCRSVTMLNEHFGFGIELQTSTLINMYPMSGGLEPGGGNDGQTQLKTLPFHNFIGRSVTMLNEHFGFGIELQTSTLINTYPMSGGGLEPGVGMTDRHD